MATIDQGLRVQLPHARNTPLAPTVGTAMTFSLEPVIDGVRLRAGIWMLGAQGEDTYSVLAPSVRACIRELGDAIQSRPQGPEGNVLRSSHMASAVEAKLTQYLFGDVAGG